MVLLQICLLMLGPALFMRLHKLRYLPEWLGPIVLCYIFGIAWATIFGSYNLALTRQIGHASILLAIPLLLFTTDIKGWLGQSRSTILSFLACVFSAIAVTLGITSLGSWPLDHLAATAGMTAGVNIGGTPNMQAIGLALEAPHELFIALNAVDILCGAIYLLFLTSIAKPLLSKIYPPYLERTEASQSDSDNEKLSLRGVLAALGLAVAVIGLTAGTNYLVFGDVDRVAFVILGATTLSILLSLYSPVRQMEASFDTGHYLLLVFSISIGMQTQIQEILASLSMLTIYYASIYVATILLHYFLAWLLRIDRDTVMITSTASIFGPAFVGQIAAVLGNRSILLGGMLTGLVGYALGNYVGIGIAYLLGY